MSEILNETSNSEDDLSTAPLTSNPPPINPRLKYSFGRKVIMIPLSEESVNEITIQRYLPYILRQHSCNKADCIRFDRVYRGDTHIFDKIRENDSEKKNSIISENHAFYMVEFKKGQMFGNPIKYSCVDDSISTDDITYLNKYMNEQNKSSKDIENGEKVFKYGNSYRIVLPKAYNKIVNLEKQSPFTITNLDNESTFVVYSKNYEHKKLFAGVITTIDSPYPDRVQYEILIYTRTHSYRFRCFSLNPEWDMIDFKSKNKHYLEYIPIIEYYTNTARLGIVEVVETILDAINDTSSDAVDNINDYVNSILAIYNMTIDRETKKEIDENRAISLRTTDPNRPADAKYLVNALNQTDVMVKYEALVKVAYNIVGVPMPTTKTTSGGDTGDARELGGGWESANIVANQHEEPLKQGEKMVLEIVLNICRKIPNCPVNELYPSDIAINFNRTNRSNLLSKMQALKYLYDMNMPLEAALNIVGVVANPHEVAIEWKNNVDKKSNEMKLQQETQKQNSITSIQEN